ncbi:MAG TPA: nitrous oxide reductase family maturation protein NosD [Pantanalinema sp.]
MRPAALILVATLAPLALPFAVRAAEWRVGPGGFPTIAAAIAAAHPGDVIRIPAGRYPERLFLDKPLTLVGEGMPTIDGLGKGDVVAVKAPGCRIVGLHLTGSSREILSDAAAIKIDADRTVVERCTIDQSLYGLYISDTQHARIMNNDITGIATMGIHERGDGIRLHNSAHNLIKGNRIQDTRDGIYFNASPFNDMRDNAIRRVRYGLHYMSSDDNTFSRNRFTETEAGSALMFSRRIHLRDNLFAGNRGYRAYGLLIKDCEDSTVEGNAVVGNRVGIFLDGAMRSTITRNRVVGNDLGFEVRGSSEGNTLSANTIAGNTETIATPTGIGENTWRGNYWSDYRGYDLDGDGLGDVPHEAGSVFSFLVENYPPARLFLLSPAVQALEFAERTFPIVDAPSIRDPAPAVHPTVAAEPAAGERREASPSAPFLALAAGLLLLGLLPLLASRRALRP